MREFADLQQNKTRSFDDIRSKYGERDGDLERSLREKEEELEIYKSGMDQTLLELNELRMVCCWKARHRALLIMFRTAGIRTKLLMTKSIRSS